MTRAHRPRTAPAPEPLESRLLMAVDVLTYHNDLARTGQNLAETTLSPANVNVSTFGKVGQVAVDGQVYAQPLVKTGVAMPGGGTRDLVFVATEHDSLYAFDARTLAPVWHVSMIDESRGITSVPSKDTGAFDVNPEVGITSTPVIDPATSTIYLDAAIKEVRGKKAHYDHTIHAIDLATGAEKAATAVVASVPGRGAGGAGGRVSFRPLRELQRTGLLLLNGVVYVGYASYGDIDPYHGWLIGFDAKTLKVTGAFNTSPDGTRGGIWMSGAAPSADAQGNIYLAVGNGTLDGGKRPRDVGDSVVKLSTTRGKLRLADYFAPFNQAKLNAQDLDFGSGGVLLLPDQPGPHPHLLVTGGKEGRLYVIDRDAMGGYSKKGDRVVQALPGSLIALFAAPAYYQGTVYVAGTGERKNPTDREALKAFPVAGGRLAAPTTGAFIYGYPGTSPSISADGGSGGIVWTLDNGANSTFGPAILRAYDASDITRELYDSTQSPGDRAGTANKFAVPTVANGSVYVGGNGQLTMYGLRPTL